MIDRTILPQILEERAAYGPLCIEADAQFIVGMDEISRYMHLPKQMIERRLEKHSKDAEAGDVHALACCFRTDRYLRLARQRLELAKAGRPWRKRKPKS